MTDLRIFNGSQLNTEGHILTVGDTVIVDRYDGETEVTVLKGTKNVNQNFRSLWIDTRYLLRKV